MIIVTNDSNLNDLEINQTNNSLIEDNSSITSDTQEQSSNTSQPKLDPNNFQLIIESQIQINLSDLQLDKSIQSREKINTKKVDEYSELIKEGFEFDSFISVIKDETESGKFILIDGFHRMEAYRRNSKQIINCNVMRATYKDESENNIEVNDSKYVSLFSILGNRKHGLPRTNADKRKAIRLVLTHPDFENCSDNQVHKVCIVSREIVKDVRNELIEQGILKNNKIENIVISKRNDTYYPMNTSKIGSKSKSKKRNTDAEEPNQELKMENSVLSVQAPELEEYSINSDVELPADNIPIPEKIEQIQYKQHSELERKLSSIVGIFSSLLELPINHDDIYKYLELTYKIDSLNKNLLHKFYEADSCGEPEIAESLT